MLSILLFNFCDYWKVAYPHSRQFSDSFMNPFDVVKLESLLLTRCEEKERSFICDCLKINPNERFSTHQLKIKSIFSTQLSTIHRTTIVSTEEKIKNVEELISQLTSSSTTNMNEIKSCLDDLMLGLSDNLTESQKEITNQIQSLNNNINNGNNNMSKEDLMNLLNELKKLI